MNSIVRRRNVRVALLTAVAVNVMIAIAPAAAQVAAPSTTTPIAPEQQGITGTTTQAEPAPADASGQSTTAPDNGLGGTDETTVLRKEAGFGAVRGCKSA
ncbi:MAG: hypothetical protein EOO77_38885 [Oxalobacteraceae bacterium]|nr:MAG: hypothetical protein EOO77_38885 [Oxalobacteraceae bacterium]